MQHWLPSNWTLVVMGDDDDGSNAGANQQPHVHMGMHTHTHNPFGLVMSGLHTSGDSGRVLKMDTKSAVSVFVKAPSFHANDHCYGQRNRFIRRDLMGYLSQNKQNIIYGSCTNFFIMFSSYIK